MSYPKMPKSRRNSYHGYPAEIEKRKKIRKRKRFFTALLIILILAALVLLGIILLKGNEQQTSEAQKSSPPPTKTATAPSFTLTPTPTTTEITPTPSAAPIFVPPAAIEATRPSVFGMTTGLLQNGEEVAAIQRDGGINFGAGSSYTQLEGVITFRGNNYRDAPSFGTATVTQKKLEEVWRFRTGSLPKGGGSGAWTGNGWTGQPILVRWPGETKAVINMYPAAKAKSGLVEVIYASMDGKVHFIDLETGEKTRDSLNIGAPFKGAGSLDPRGIPLLYVGAGDKTGSLTPRSYIYSLVDFKKLYEYGANDSFALRGWTAYDSSPLVDAQSDTLIQLGENGIIYTTKLNTKYDPQTGALSIDPSEIIKFRYKAQRSNDQAFWLGIETSPVIWRNFLYAADNGGHLMCIDMNTMEVVWMQDVLDDTNCTPVFEENPEDGSCYLYISTSLHWTAKAGNDPRKGTVPIWKINAITGEIVWETEPYPCYTIEGVSGGVQSSPVLGCGNISNLVLFTIARTPGVNSGKLVALDKNTGKEVWSFPMNRYSWSSPVAVCTESGEAYIIQCDSGGNMFLLDGKTGELLDTVSLEANVEASPAVFGNMVVVGTRGQNIFGIEIK